MSFHSSHLVCDLVKSIDKKIPIVILENSQNYDLKKKLEKEHENVKVIIPNENLGFAKGANFAIRQIKSEYIFLNPSDVFLPKKCINELIECINDRIVNFVSQSKCGIRGQCPRSCSPC